MERALGKASRQAIDFGCWARVRRWPADDSVGVNAVDLFPQVPKGCVDINGPASLHPLLLLDICFNCFGVRENVGEDVLVNR